jgi:uncharacterized protein (TIGR00297 family)
MKTSALCIGFILAADQVSAFAPSVSSLSVSHNPILPNLHKHTSHQPPSSSSLRTFTFPIPQRQYEDLTKSTSTSLHAIPLDASSLTSTILSNTPPVPLPLSLLLNVGLFLVLKSKLSKLLTPEGYYHSLALGTLLWHTLGWMGWSTCVLYLGLGSLVTKVKMAEKEQMGIAEGRGGRRGPENVWGSAATALLLASASLQLLPSSGTVGASAAGEAISQFASYDLLILGYVSSLATKLADTFASEIGKAYGKTTFLITTFERADPGTEGAVSLEGTLAAAVGGSLLPIYAVGIGFLKGGVGAIGVATLAAFLATNAESLIGATLQGKKGFEWMTNEVVNFFNTVIGAGIAIGVGKVLF